MLAAELTEPAIANFFSGCWPNYLTNYSSLNYFGDVVLRGVSFGSYSSTLTRLLNIIVSIQLSAFSSQLKQSFRLSLRVFLKG
jgi:hypothetical protein